MTVILGIDPGSRLTGYGVIKVEGSRNHYVTSGVVQCANGALSERLQLIYQGIQQIIQTFQPQEAAIEQVFLHQNAGSALKLGQARGAAMVAAAVHLTEPVAEYSARQIKQSVVGHGAAKKEQVQHMVKVLLNLSGVTELAEDAADGLAVALCHAHSRHSLGKLTAQQVLTRGRFRRGRLR